MDRHIAKLEGISRDLSEFGLDLANRVEPPNEEYFQRMGAAFIAVSEAIADIADSLERGAQRMEGSGGSSE